MNPAFPAALQHSDGDDASHYFAARSCISINFARTGVGWCMRESWTAIIPKWEEWEHNESRTMITLQTCPSREVQDYQEYRETLMSGTSGRDETITPEFKVWTNFSNIVWKRSWPSQICSAFIQDLVSLKRLERPMILPLLAVTLIRA
jgi:hypothetical protein